jgi:hypothetical protein
MGERIQFRAINVGVDQEFAVSVGFQMPSQPDEDMKGLLFSRSLPEHEEEGDDVYVEFGSPEQFCMHGGIESVSVVPGFLRVRFSQSGARQMDGHRTIEVDFSGVDSDMAEIAGALDYIFEGFDGYTRSPEPASPADG